MHPNQLPPEEFFGFFVGFVVTTFGTVALLRKA